MPPESTEEGRWFADNLLVHEPMLRAWLQGRFGASVSVNDVIQEAYLRVLRIRQTDTINAPKAFLFATARNLALNAARSAKVRGEHVSEPLDESELLDESSNVRESVAQYEELEILTKAIQSLPDRCRQIFTLRKVYGLSQADIARKLDISARTVNAQLAIGLNKCADYVGKFREKGSA
ncbi:MAG: RNA polymerase sigma factor [Opitutae bacterium]|nr:RNA polymerase sigma factor [Opitutae bacterium]